MEHKKTSVARDEFGKFLYKPGTQEFVTMDTPAGPMQITTGKTMWICSCGKTDCPDMAD